MGPQTKMITQSKCAHTRESTRRLAKETKAERCFGNQQLAIAFHMFVKLVAQTHSFMHC